MTPLWREELEAWLKPFVSARGDRQRGRMCPSYLATLIAPGDRKSIQPMAVREGVVGCDQLLNFVAEGTWDRAPVDAFLLKEADRLVGGEDAFLIIATPRCRRPEGGGRSQRQALRGVAPQYATSLRKNANWQTLVSTTLARRRFW